MALLKRDALKIVIFLVICGVLRVLNSVVPGGEKLSLVCFTALVGFLPYVAARTSWKANKVPFFIFVVLELILTAVTSFAPNELFLHLLILLDDTIFFLLVAAVLAKRGYSVKPVISQWPKWLATVVFFYVSEMFVYPFIFAAVRPTVLNKFTFLIIPLVYLIITYGLTIWSTRKAK